MGASRPAPPIPPSPAVALRVEELLREQLAERGVAVASLEPHEIAANMVCHVGPDYSMTYFWKGEAILRVAPESDDGETVARWRMFTKDDIELTG